MRSPLAVLLLLAALTAAADPTAAQFKTADLYDGQKFSVEGLKQVQAASNGWVQYQWTEGRSVYHNPKQNSFAVVLADGTEIYRMADDQYLYRFPDGRQITSNPRTKVRTWNPMAGDSAPDFTLKTLEGQIITLSALKGQVVLLDFWASWCGPCQQYLPGTQALHKKFGAQGLKVVGVNIEGDLAKARKNAADLKLTFPSVMAEAGPAGANWGAIQVSAFGIDSIPRGILIDKKGVIRASETVLEDEDLIRKLLAE